MFPSLCPTPELQSRDGRSSPARGRSRPRVYLSEMLPGVGIQNVSGILIYRAPSGLTSLLSISDEIDAYRESHQIGSLRQFVIVLPPGSSRDPFAEELHPLSLRGIGVQVEGTVSFIDLIAAARGREMARGS